jgi:hypothetical protein
LGRLRCVVSFLSDPRFRSTQIRTPEQPAL